MKNKIIKIIMIILGIGTLDYGIITEIDGIGRFAIILFGTIISIIACIIPFNKKWYKNFIYFPLIMI